MALRTKANLCLAIIAAMAGVVFFCAPQVASSQTDTANSPAPLISENHPVAWWFTFKFNAKSYPNCSGSSAPVCLFGGTPAHRTASQQYVFASSESGSLQLGDVCLGDTSSDPVGATFAQVYNGGFYYVVWNDQFYGDPELAGCSNSCSGPWGHSKGVLAWNEAGEGVAMQVTTPSWPASGSSKHPRTAGNTLGCIDPPDNVLVSQSFFAVRLTQADVLQVLKALENASVATNPKDSMLAHLGGPADIQAAANRLGKRSGSKAVFKTSLSTGVGVLSKPSALHVPPWQLVSAELGQVSLRVASWWTNPAIDSTSASTAIDCWDVNLPKPGAVQIATSGSWGGKAFGLKGGAGPDFNHAKVGVTTSGSHHLTIFGDMNQQGVLSDENCGRSQNGRGGLFFIVEDEALFTDVSRLLQGDSAPTTSKVR